MIPSLVLLAAVAGCNIRLGPDGEILAWLASGPFPNVGALEFKGHGFATDYLAGEPLAAPKEGDVIPMIPAEKAADPALIVKRRPGWVLGLGSPSSGIDLFALLDGNKPAVAYLYTTLVSPSERDAQILFGSDDGAKVYLNGQLLFTHQIARGIKRDEDRVPIHLREGDNRLLFKIEQGNGGWGLLARVADLEGRGLKDVVERLSLSSSLSERLAPGERWVRKGIGRAGALDLTAAARYDEVSARARRWLERFRPEAQESGRLEGVLRDSALRLEGGLDATELSRDLSGGAEAIRQEFVRARAPLLASTQKAEPLFHTDVTREDYAAVMPGGRYFVHADGRPFIPIGYNHNPDWPEFEEANPERPVYKPEETAQYMAHLKACGVNILRLMVETPPSGNLENPIGTFSPEHVRWIDNIVSDARANGIKLILTPWDTFWMNLRFDTTPYNPALGGSLERKIDFITSPVLRAQEKRRVRFMIDRWGNTGTVFSWELLNEADLWWGATPGQLREWITDMAGFAKSYERRKWGRNHLLSVSISEPMPHGELGEVAFDLPVLDYATTHLYIGASRAPTEPTGPALAINKGVGYCLSQIQDKRPYMDTENGPIDRWIDSEALDEQVFRGMIWAHLASGAAGSGFRWPYRHPHHLTEGMLADLKAMSSFVKKVPWTLLAGERVSVEASGSSATCGFGTREAAVVWAGDSGEVVGSVGRRPFSFFGEGFRLPHGRLASGRQRYQNGRRLPCSCFHRRPGGRAAAGRALTQWGVREEVERLDREDPLAGFRRRFAMPACRAYLDGNSLGPLPLAARERVLELLDAEWSARGVGGWNRGWIDLPQRLGAKIATLIGARPDEVLVCDSTSVDFYKLLWAALEVQSPRRVVLAEQSSFPTNLYVAEADSLGAELRLVESLESIGPDVAVVALNHVAFKSGWLHPMAEINQAAKETGAMVLWDLSHSVGVVPMDLNAGGAELAVGCTYKYLNGGPGAPAFLYVRKELQSRLRSPIQGWFGHQASFDFDTKYVPAEGIERFLAGTPPILSMAAVEAGVDLAIEAGMERIRAKSVALTELMIQGWEILLKPLGVELATPKEPERRGSHVSFRHSHAGCLVERLVRKHQVIPDFRRPDVIRFGANPLYTSFSEVLVGLEALQAALLEGKFENSLSLPGRVT